MSKQRDLFYGREKKKSRKVAKRVPPVCRRRRKKIKPEEIAVRFDNKSVTAHGGYTVVRRFMNWIKVEKLFAQYIKIDKRSNGYRIAEMGRYMIESKLLGCDRLMHVEILRDDPLLKSSYGIEGLPAGKTCGDYLQSYDRIKNRALESMNGRLVNGGVDKIVGRQQVGVIVDYDSATMTVYGKQEGADRGRCFRHKDKPGFQPKFAFIGGLDLMINQKLYPQSYTLGKDFMDFHEETLKKIPKGMGVIGVRGDCGIYSEKRIKYFEEEGYIYGISAPMNAPMRSAVWGISETEWEESIDEKGHPISVAIIEYKPTSWSGEKKYTFVISRRLKKNQSQECLFEQNRYKYFAYITNKKGTVKEQWKFCVERCSLERCIKEAKLGFAIDSLPCMEYEANVAYLGHIQLAYNIAIFFKLSILPLGANRWTIDTIRRRLINIPANFKKVAGNWRLSLPKLWPFKEIFLHAEIRLAFLPDG